MTTSTTPMLEARDVHKSFGSYPVLRGVDLEVQEGEVMCMLGASGSGKSTFLRCINHIEALDEGTIRVHGDLVGFRLVDNQLVELSDKKVAQRRQDIGMVFQQFNLFPHMTTLENVVHAPIHTGRTSRSEAREEGQQLLRQVGLGAEAEVYPHQLSGGQQQRVAIARALAMHPKLMLFDEPTSALDPELVSEVLDVMRNLAEKGMTMIVVTHEMGFARGAADRVAFMSDGQIVDCRASQEFFTSREHPEVTAFLSKVL